MRSAGPAVVAIGGGHGLSASLRAIRRYAGSIVAVVSVADDGGSSGRLRAAHPHLPAPGDVRRCLGALAAEGSAFGAALEHRFTDGDLAGHALGNLVLASLTERLGSFAAAVDEVAALVGAVGQVLPATSGPVALEGVASTPVGAPVGGLQRIVGQVAVQGAAGLSHLGLRPPAPPSPPGVSAAILGADQVILGPGSLFTSVLAAAVVPTVRDALARATGERILVANLGPQVPETAGFTVADEISALGRHGIAIDVVVVDPTRPAEAVPDGVRVLDASVADEDGRAHHPDRLAQALGMLVSSPSGGVR